MAGGSDQVGADRPAGAERTPKPSQATKLVDLGRRTPLFHDPEGNAYASMRVGDHDETWRLRSSRFRSWLARGYWEIEGASPRAGALQDALTTLDGLARFGGPELPVYLRHAHVDDVLYVDIGDPAWRAIEVSAAGWRIVEHPPVRFRRPRGMLALPEPVHDGRDGIGRLRAFLNVTDEDDLRLLVAFAVGCYSEGPYPVLVLNGEQGAAKSTAGRVLRWLVDPARTPDRSAPRDERDLIIAANNAHLVAFDNLSWLRDWQSDGFSRLSTGAGFGTRELYTDAEETLFWAAKPIILNGISDLAVRSDLLDRSLLVTLPRIPDEERVTEDRFWASFRAAAPSILAGLLDAVSGSLGGHRSVRLEQLPRMADFAVWVAAAEPALGWSPGSFLAAYRRNRASGHQLALESVGIVPPLVHLPVVWEGTSAELLERLCGLAGETVVKGPDWPANPRVLSGLLRRLSSDLRSIGVEVTFAPRTSQRRSIRISRAERRRGRPSSPSLPAPDRAHARAERNGHDGHDGHDGDDGDDGPVRRRSPSTMDKGPDREHADDAHVVEDQPTFSWETLSGPPQDGLR